MYVRVAVDRMCEAFIKEVIDRDDDEALFLESVGQLERWAMMYAAMKLQKEMMDKGPEECITDIDISDCVEKNLEVGWWREHAVLAVDAALERMLNGDTKVIGHDDTEA